MPNKLFDAGAAAGGAGGGGGAGLSVAAEVKRLAILLAMLTCGVGGDAVKAGRMDSSACSTEASGAALAGGFGGGGGCVEGLG